MEPESEVMTKTGHLAMELSKEKKRLTQELKELQIEVDDLKPTTPTGTIDWYVKWVASIFLLTAMSMRGIPEYQHYDLSFSIIGVIGWLVVSMIWEDRALIVLNAIGLALLLKNLFQAFVI